MAFREPPNKGDFHNSILPTFNFFNCHKPISPQSHVLNFYPKVSITVEESWGKPKYFS